MSFEWFVILFLLLLHLVICSYVIVCKYLNGLFVRCVGEMVSYNNIKNNAKANPKTMWKRICWFAYADMLNARCLTTLLILICVNAHSSIVSSFIVHHIKHWMWTESLRKHTYNKSNTIYINITKGFTSHFVKHVGTMMYRTSKSSTHTLLLKPNHVCILQHDNKWASMERTFFRITKITKPKESR